MMYKDTIMSPEALVPYLSTTDLYSAMCVDYKKAFGAQAKISFKAGMQEVLEAIHYEPNSNAFYVQPDKWQAKLKEWGIE